MGYILKIRAWDEVIAKSNLAFWECPPPIDFTYHKAQGKIYHEPNLCK
jgi:hypothetical protein